ncbi:MAG: hypothetical protein MUP76_06230, partial [Acidimicrobiia bacterium]|nr:hypothetical protein [Acidimicrobiia bacterium]
MRLGPARLLDTLTRTLLGLDGAFLTRTLLRLGLRLGATRLLHTLTRALLRLGLRLGATRLLHTLTR